MSTKQEIRNKIDDSLQGENTPLSQVRDMLKDGSVNILDNIYGTVSSDNSDNQSFLRLVTPLSCKFDLQWVKQGRLILFTGKIYNVVQTITKFARIQNNVPFIPGETVAQGSELIPFDATTGSEQSILGNPYHFGIGYKLSPNESVQAQTISLRNEGQYSTIYMRPSLSVGDECYFSLIYRTSE